jgi:hypothetical protein
MPREKYYHREFTLRGREKAAQSHNLLQLSSYDPTAQYEIVEFYVSSANTDLASNCTGTLTLGKNNSLDSTTPDFNDDNQIAWSNYQAWQNVPPGIGEQFIISRNSTKDDILFNYDIWVHTKDNVGVSDVNWFIKIREYRTSAEAGSISSLRQYLVNHPST